MAARYALLVGVSEYPALAREWQLKAPANDVRLMRQVLLQRGFDAPHVEVLADGVEGAGLPTRAAILAALQGLATRVHAGDTVYLHFAGHGSLQLLGTDNSASSTPTPQWQPVFLPRDTQGWNGESGPSIANAISDTVLRQLVDRINETGAFVFAVFDACHSAKLVRGALPGTDASQLRVREVAPSALGLPGQPPPDVWPDWIVRPEPTTRDIGTSARRGQAVYFYAAQSFELAATTLLASGGEAQWHGLFSWHIAQALALGQPMTYRQLGQHVLSRFDLLPDTKATPLFSGDGLDQSVFAERATVHRQWPLERVQGRLVMPAGALSGLAEGALLAVVTDPLAPSGDGPMQPPRSALGFVRVSSVETNRSQLEPVAWLGWAAPDPETLPTTGWVRLMVNPPSFALNVAVDRTACHSDCLAGRALVQLQRDGVPGVDVHWVAGNPDAWLRANDTGVRLQLPGISDFSEGSWGIAVPSGGESLAQEVLAQQTGAALHRLARTRNLLQLASGMALRAPFKDVQLKLTIQHQGKAQEAEVPMEQLASITPRDLLRLSGRNVSGDPVDLAAFWLGADLSIKQMYPQDSGESPRLPGGAVLRPVGMAVAEKSGGVERLLVLMVPMARRQEVSDFRFLEQSPLSRVRGASDPTLQALMDACFADYRARGDAAPALPAEQLGLKLFTFQVLP